jgi:hypothetical protein
MDRIKTLFLLFICVGPIHIAEQLVLGIDELYAIQSTVGVYYAWFPPAYADHATVILIVFGLTTVLLLVYAQLLGGTAQLIVIGLFGLVGVSEVHHILETLVRGRYDPGAVTSELYIWVGALLLTSVWREYRRRFRSRTESAMLSPSEAL